MTINQFCSHRAFPLESQGGVAVRGTWPPWLLPSEDPGTPTNLPQGLSKVFTPEGGGGSHSHCPELCAAKRPLRAPSPAVRAPSPACADPCVRRPLRAPPPAVRAPSLRAPGPPALCVCVSELHLLLALTRGSPRAHARPLVVCVGISGLPPFFAHERSCVSSYTLKYTCQTLLVSFI